MNIDEFFAGSEIARQLFEAVRRAVDAAGPAEIRTSKSQVSFRRRIAFASVWMPGQFLRRQAAPLVLTLFFHQRDPSPRWKEVVEPASGRYTHHLELYAIEDIDDEVRAWLLKAWQAAA